MPPDFTWHMNSMMTWGSIFWGVIVLGTIWLVVRGTSYGSAQNDVPETILKRRYAHGEINREEYERRLADLRK